jgi:hypothetical protein
MASMREHIADLDVGTRVRRGGVNRNLAASRAAAAPETRFAGRDDPGHGRRALVLDDVQTLDQ